MAQIKITVYKKERIFNLMETPLDFMKYFQAQIDKIPSEFIDNSRIELYNYVEYDNAIMDIEIYYFRDETDEEQNDRIKKELESKQLREAQERAIFERLKLKYENK